MSKLLQLRNQLLSQHHRKLIILSGSTDWQVQMISGIYQPHERVFWVASSALKSSEDSHVCIPEAFNNQGYECIESKRLSYYLGQEISGAIIDIQQGIGADTLGIVSGMIKSGGLLILLTPDETSWRNLENPENARFLNTPLTLKDAKTSFTEHLINSWSTKEVLWIKQDEDDNYKINNQINTTASQTLPTADQINTIKSIHSVAFGHRKRPLVISADRGRGKSSALGLAAIDCLLDGKQHIVMTAHRVDQTKAAFRHALISLETLIEQNINITLLANKNGFMQFIHQDQVKTLEFIAPDQLILNPTGADVLMVDEAAHLPTPLLNELLMRHHRLVFATTLHGYEGSGRGFELRFKKQLTLHTPNWKNCHLTQPIRWAENDPLEVAINGALLLNASLTNIDESSITPTLQNDSVEFTKVDHQQLLQEPELLKSLFALLVQAHYQTSPNDLQQLLNAPNLLIVIASLKQDQHVKILGAVLCVEEGKLNPGKNRAHGHLVPQLLTKHYAQQDFLMLSTLRIMRIAVHPVIQRNGVGLQLIKEVEKHAIENRVDYISSSFGASEELLPFWFEQNFWPCHVGVKRDKASGSHNLVVAKPLTAMARQSLSFIQKRFQEQFPHLLLESLPHLPAGQVWRIMQTFRFKKRNLGLDKAITNYLNNSRPYESVSNKLWEWSLQSAGKIAETPVLQQEIWCDKIMKMRPWQEVAHQHHLAGRKGVEKAMKQMIEPWVEPKSQHKPWQQKPSQAQPKQYKKIERYS